MIKFPTFPAFIFSFLLYAVLISFLIFKAADAIKKTQSYSEYKNSFMNVLVVTDNRADIISSPKLHQKEEKDKTQIITKKMHEDETQLITTNKASTLEDLTQTKAENSDKISENLTQTKVENSISENSNQVLQKQENIAENINISNLFDDIKIPKQQAITSRQKSMQKNQSAQQKAMQAIKALQSLDEIKAPQETTSGEFNEFKGKIYRIIATHWQKYLASTNDKILVRITLSANGQLINYKFITSSYNDDFTNKVKDLMQTLKNVAFPQTPNKQRQDIEILLSDEIQINME